MKINEQKLVLPLTHSKIYRHTNTDRIANKSFTTNFSSNEFQNGSTSSGNSTIFDSVGAERERVRMEFFATYDVMTGVRIAATLGGFFGLMVFLVVYKSRGETQETLKALKVYILPNAKCRPNTEQPSFVFYRIQK